ncbi:MAG: hypothetical protein LBI29_01835 [Rickettsiales bacterium]|jgi:F-type H+-transporting ATPase subunit b|nr:hypothetical protein [Rickettsiales bacterium]
MNIDTFTLVTQILNFLLLLFILKRFLYRPVAKIIHDRQEYVRSTIETAEDRLREAESKKEAYQAELNSINDQKKVQMDHIAGEMVEYRAIQMGKIREEMEAKRTEFLKHLDGEKDALLDSVVASICLNMGDFLMDVFASLTSNSFENSTLNRFLDEIGNLPNESIERINKSSGGVLVFISSFELNAAQKTLAEKAFRKKCISYETLVFQTDKEIGLGNRIVAGSLTINSNIRDIVDQFRAKLSQTTT